MLKKLLIMFAKRFWHDRILEVAAEEGATAEGMGILGVWTIIGYIATQLGFAALGYVTVKKLGELITAFNDMKYKIRKRKEDGIGKEVVK